MNDYDWVDPLGSNTEASDKAKLASVDRAIDASTLGYGEGISVAALVDHLEQEGWRYDG